MSGPVKIRSTLAEDRDAVRRNIGLIFPRGRGRLAAGDSFKAFVYPRVLAMSVLFTAIFSAASIVWDHYSGPWPERRLYRAIPFCFPQ